MLGQRLGSRAAESWSLDLIVVPVLAAAGTAALLQLV